MAIPQQVACSAKIDSAQCVLSPHIRIGFGISEEEKEAVKNRGDHILKVLKDLGIDVKKVPVVSVVLPSRGLRADIACQGVLSELSCVGLLNFVTYIAGMSTSTWWMASWYNKIDGWKDLKKAENECRRRLPYFWDISVALEKLCEAAKRDDYSLTDFYSYSMVYYHTCKLLDSHLSQVREESKMGNVPYPIFASIDHDLKFYGKNAWFELTPDWAGYPPPDSSIPGAYVSTPFFGIEFERGMPIKQKPERDFSYLRGLCGSALADMNITREKLWDFLMKFIIYSYTAPPDGETFRNFVHKTVDCLLEWKWGTTNNFLYKYGKAPISFPIDQKYIYLTDAGWAFNSPSPLVLPPLRKSDIIYFFDFSEGDPFETIKATENYCKTHHIPFPSVDDCKLDQEAKAPSDFYIFEGENAPVVMHFPLFNKVNCGSEEGIKSRNETYKTINFTRYSDKEVCELLDLSKANVRNNKDRILKKIIELARGTS